MSSTPFAPAFSFPPVPFTHRPHTSRTSLTGNRLDGFANTFIPRITNTDIKILSRITTVTFTRESTRRRGPSSVKTWSNYGHNHSHCHATQFGFKRRFGFGSSPFSASTSASKSLPMSMTYDESAPAAGHPTSAATIAIPNAATATATLDNSDPQPDLYTRQSEHNEAFHVLDRISANVKIVLVEPQGPINVGSIARLMQNFHLTNSQLILVRPAFAPEQENSSLAKDVAPLNSTDSILSPLHHPDIKMFATHAYEKIILANAQVVNSLEEAVGDCSFVVATTARKRDANASASMRWMTIPQVMQKLERVLLPPQTNHNQPHGLRQGQPGIEHHDRSDLHLTYRPKQEKVAWVFGSERCGLSNKDISLADAVVSIPTSPEQPAMNLSHAVSICLYSYYSYFLSALDAFYNDLLVASRAMNSSDPAHCSLHHEEQPDEPAAALVSERSHLLAHLVQVLESVDYFRTETRRDSTALNFERMISRLELTSIDVRILRGVLRRIQAKVEAPPSGSGVKPSMSSSSTPGTEVASSLPMSDTNSKPADPHSPHELTPQQFIYVVLTSIFVTCLIIADVVGVKLFEIPLPFPILGYKTIEHSAGMIPFPVTFILGDVINEYYGPKAAKQTVYIGLVMAVIVFMVMNIAQALPYLDKPYNVTQESFDMIFGSSKLIFVASVTAYFVGSMSDIWLFGVIKKATKGKFLWLRATGSTIISQMLDSLVVSYIAFSLGKTLTGQPAASLDEVLQIAATGYGLKFFLANAVTPLIYVLKGVLQTKFNLKPIPVDENEKYQ